MKLHPKTRWLACALLLLCSGGAAAQTEAIPLTSGPVLPLYRALRSVGLDPQKVFAIREAVIDREDVHLWLNDGTIAFTRAVDGHVTGAYFEGDGEVLVRPPDRMERASLGLFTDAGVLEERFSSAYLRFNDDTAKELEPYLRPPEDAADFVAHNEARARAWLRSMPCGCAFRLPAAAAAAPGETAPVPDRLLHRVSRESTTASSTFSSTPAVRSRSWWARLRRCARTEPITTCG